jgi:hypothetical protein
MVRFAPAFRTWCRIMFNLLLGGLIALLTWGPRAVMNRCGKDTDICGWLDEHLPID